MWSNDQFCYSNYVSLDISITFSFTLLFTGDDTSNLNYLNLKHDLEKDNFF